MQFYPKHDQILKKYTKISEKGNIQYLSQYQHFKVKG